MNHYISSEEGTAQTLRLTDSVRDSVTVALLTFLDQVNCVETTDGVYVEMHGEDGTAVVWQDAIISSVVLLATTMRAACGPLVDELWVYENGVAAAQRQVQWLQEEIEDERLNVEIARQRAQMLVLLNHQLTSRIESLTASVDAPTATAMAMMATSTSTSTATATTEAALVDNNGEANANANANTNANTNASTDANTDAVVDGESASVSANASASASTCVSVCDDASARAVLQYIQAAMERERVDGRATREEAGVLAALEQIIAEFEVELHGSEDAAGLFYEYKRVNRTAIVCVADMTAAFMALADRITCSINPVRVALSETQCLLWAIMDDVRRLSNELSTAKALTRHARDEVAVEHSRCNQLLERMEVVESQLVAYHACRHAADLSGKSVKSTKGPIAIVVEAGGEVEAEVEIKAEAGARAGAGAGAEVSEPSTHEAPTTAGMADIGIAKSDPNHPTRCCNDDVFDTDRAVDAAENAKESTKENESDTYAETYAETNNEIGNKNENENENENESVSVSMSVSVLEPKLTIEYEHEHVDGQNDQGKCKPTLEFSDAELEFDRKTDPKVALGSLSENDHGLEQEHKREPTVEVMEHTTIRRRQLPVPSVVCELVLSSSEKSMEGAPDGELYAVSVLSRDQVLPSDDPDTDQRKLECAITKAKMGQETTWAAQYAAIDILRRMAIHHPDRLDTDDIACALEVLVCPAALELRSALCRNALLCVEDLVVSISSEMSRHLRVVIPVLLQRSTDEKSFLRRLARNVLDVCVSRCAGNALLMQLMQCGSTANTKNAQAVGVAGIYFVKCLEAVETSMVESIVQAPEARFLSHAAMFLGCKVVECKAATRKALQLVRQVVGDMVFEALAESQLGGSARLDVLKASGQQVPKQSRGISCARRSRLAKSKHNVQERKEQTTTRQQEQQPQPQPQPTRSQDMTEPSPSRRLEQSGSDSGSASGSASGSLIRLFQPRQPSDSCELSDPSEVSETSEASASLKSSKPSEPSDPLDPSASLKPVQRLEPSETQNQGRGASQQESIRSRATLSAHAHAHTRAHTDADADADTPTRATPISIRSSVTLSAHADADADTPTCATPVGVQDQEGTRVGVASVGACHVASSIMGAGRRVSESRLRQPSRADRGTRRASSRPSCKPLRFVPAVAAFAAPTVAAMG